MNTPETQQIPRILVNYGNGSEVLDLMMRADLSVADFIWWSKSGLATQRIQERLPQAHFIESQVRHLSALAPPFPLRYLFPHKCTLEKIQAASQVFPAEWVAHVLRWERARAAQQDSELEEIYTLLAALYLAEAIRILNLTQPDLLLLRSGNNATDAALAITARVHNIPILFTERGAFPNTLFLAPALIGPEMMPENEHGSDDAVDNSYSDTFISQYLNHDHSAWWQPPRQTAQTLRQRWQIPEDHRIVFYAAQRPTDANMLLNSPHFRSNGDFVHYIINVLKGLDKIALVIKPHPKESPKSDKDIHDALQIAKQHNLLAICDREVNIKDAIPLASVVVSINSTTGLESLLHGVPVVAGGEAYYSHRGYTFDIRSNSDPAEIERLRTFFRQPELTDKQRHDFHAFICRLNAKHQFFMQPLQGQNGPDDYVQTVAQTAISKRQQQNGDTKRLRFSSELICQSDALMQEYSDFQNIPTSGHTLLQLSKKYLKLKFAKQSP